MITSTMNGTTQIKNGINAGEIAGAVMGLFLFGISIYAFSLSIKANRMAIKKFEKDGIEL